MARTSEPPRRRRLLRRLAWGVLVGVVVVLAGAWIAVGRRIAPVQRDVGPPPAGCAAVSFASESGSTIHGWISAGDGDRATVVLLHALQGDRRASMGRAVPP